jgi:hypothetical protein
MEQKTGAERWSRRQLYCTVYPNGTENIDRKMEQKTIVQCTLMDRKQLQKDGAEDNCTVFPNGTENSYRKMEQKTIVQCSQMEQKTGAEK